MGVWARFPFKYKGNRTTRLAAKWEKAGTQMALVFGDLKIRIFCHFRTASGLLRLVRGRWGEVSCEVTGRSYNWFDFKREKS